ncbi:DUF3180 domain-containing protein [Buchananella felis]|uniref:DUF3180 domain-containing protein n=1 Tax=Buchananella felis TaxID=3231492 RepID=UPI003529C818
MQRLRLVTLLQVAGAVFIVALAMLLAADRMGVLAPPVLWVTAVPLFITGVVTLGVGRQVRRRDGKRALTGVAAARVVALAFACAYLGSGLLGYFAAHLVAALPHLSAPYPREQALYAAACAAASVFLVVSGLVVERWCLLDDDDEGTDSSRGADPAASAPS